MAAADPHPCPLILTAAPTGARRTQADHPALPLTPDEIGAEARRCLDAGASMVHVHVRDTTGVHTLDPVAYRAAFAAIEREVGRGQLILQATTEAVGRYQPAEQIAAVRELRPEAVSVAIAELLPAGDPTAETAAAEFFAWLGRERIGVQYILYSVDDLRRFGDLRRRGLIPGERPGLLFVLGRYTVGQQSEPAGLLPFFEARPEAGTRDLPWMVCAFGKTEDACALVAAGLGGHVRVGFENNLHLADGRLAPGTHALVAQAADGASRLRRPVAGADAAREILGYRGNA